MSPNPSLKGILNGVGRKRENWKELDGNYSSLTKFKSPPNAKNIQGSLVSCKPMNAGNTLCHLLPILTLVVPSRMKSGAVIYRRCSYSCIKASQIQALLSSICKFSYCSCLHRSVIQAQALPGSTLVLPKVAL